MPLIARTGNMAAGTAAGIIFLIALVAAAPVTWFVAGFIAGFASKGAGRGALAALISSLTTVFIMITITITLGGMPLSEIENAIGSGFLYSFIAYSISQISISTNALIYRIIIDFSLYAILGGIVGGAMMRNKVFLEEIVPKK